MSTSAQLEPATDAKDYRVTFEQVRRTATELHARHPERVPHWVIYGQNTTNHPGPFVARLWFVRPKVEPTNALLRAASLDEIRNLLPPGLACLYRGEADNPTVIESWW